MTPLSKFCLFVNFGNLYVFLQLHHDIIPVVVANKQHLLLLLLDWDLRGHFLLMNLRTNHVDLTLLLLVLEHEHLLMMDLGRHLLVVLLVHQQTVLLGSQVLGELVLLGLVLLGLHVGLDSMPVCPFVFC